MFKRLAMISFDGCFLCRCAGDILPIPRRGLRQLPPCIRALRAEHRDGHNRWRATWAARDTGTKGRLRAIAFRMRIAALQARRRGLLLPRGGVRPGRTGKPGPPESLTDMSSSASRVG